MGSVQLLDKTRKIGMLLHNNDSSKVLFDDICEVMSDILSSDVIVISRKGKVLGTAASPQVKRIGELLVYAVGSHVDADLNERMLGILSTKENVNLETLGFAADSVGKYAATIVPIDIAGERFGTLFIYRRREYYDIDDIIICEYGATVVGLEMMRAVCEENEEEDRRQRAARSVWNILSNSETEAMRQVFGELGGTEGMLVTSRIADRAGITRSVVVNALRKLESAGAIRTRSAGMKGTYIKVLNRVILDEVERREN